MIPSRNRLISSIGLSIGLYKRISPCTGLVTTQATFQIEDLHKNFTRNFKQVH